ncbi:MAG: ATP-dependent metallopeptidase FtsH/Yme1/Tma family protein [Campylobacterota bacterium]|nr:ATP-dependent metallopeptidase FtsH/Yme1/Tma family protein [Campylobacterota bacterium]
MKAIKLSFNDKNIRIIIGLLAILLSLLAFAFLRDNSKPINAAEASKLYTQNRISKIIIDGDYLRLVTPDETYKIYKGSINTKSLFQKYPVEVIENKSYIMEFLYLLVIIGAFAFLFRMIKSSRSQQLEQLHHEIDRAEEIAKPEEVRAIRSKIKFSDVAGIKDVKEELEEIIDFLKEPQKYRDLDIRLPKGVLLIGPPGVGKTLISKAVAGEADVPFFYQSGASFVHIYVGMGAKRVSELFKKAKQMAPSIIFIDEIDAVGKSRGEFRNDEREATLNQLLTEMDGFEESSGVIVIGATNKVDVLDEALLRAGRFDRRIHISLPDMEERIKTLELYLAKKPHDIDLGEVARMTVGFNSAALATLTNEAAIHAMREGRRIVEMKDFEAVKEKVLLGKRRILSFDEEEREIQSVYQGAKALIATWLDVEFEKIGIVTTRLLEHDHEIISKSQILNRIKVYLAGSIATEKAYNEKFTNAGSDIAQAKALTQQLVQNFAMGDHFIAQPNEEEMILQSAKEEVDDLLDKLHETHTKISAYLLREENITHEQAQEIIREIF